MAVQKLTAADKMFIRIAIEHVTQIARSKRLGVTIRDITQYCMCQRREIGFPALKRKGDSEIQMDLMEYTII